MPLASHCSWKSPVNFKSKLQIVLIDFWTYKISAVAPDFAHFLKYEHLTETSKISNIFFDLLPPDLDVFWILLIGSRHRNAHWDLWNGTILSTWGCSGHLFLLWTLSKFGTTLQIYFPDICVLTISIGLDYAAAQNRWNGHPVKRLWRGVRPLFLIGYRACWPR